MDARSIGIMSGSFNPVHNGHIAIAQSFLDSNYIDQLWVLLTPESPHKENEKLVLYSHRFEMLKLAFKETSGIVVSDFEKNLPTPSYTFNTIFELKKEFPEKDFFLCLGSDSLRNFKSWFKWKEILDYVSLLVASRPGSISSDQGLLDSAYFVDHNEVNISSTEIREKIDDQADIANLIPESVLSYIHKYNLYTG